MAEDGGYPVQHFEARFRLKYEKDPWHAVTPEHIASNVVRIVVHFRRPMFNSHLFFHQRQIDVYHLHPNSTYVFQIWATNQLGPGEVTEKEASTHHDTEEIGNYSARTA
jgi:hypothetical protein